MTASFQQALQQVAETEARRTYRFLVVNEHYLGHVTVHRLLCEALASDPQVDFQPERDTITLDTVDNWLERLQRAFAGWRFGPRWMQRQGLDLGRWRFQRFVALLARKRVDAKLKQAAKEGWSYDAIAFHSQTAAFACGDLMGDIPCLVSTDITNRQAAREWNHPGTRWTYWPSIRWEQSIFRQAAGVALFSDWARDAVLQENPSLDVSRIRHYPPGVTLEPFLALPLERPTSPKCQLLFVGGDFERKGGLDLVACFENGLRDFCDLHIVSNGAPAGLEKRGVHVYRDLKPYSPELLARYREADLFVLPTRNEAYGHVFIEAMAAGLPVVATAINAIPEILPDAARSLLIRPGDREALRAAITELAQNPERRVTLGQAGRERVVSMFNATDCFGRYVAWLKAIARTR